jgi:hypothetical protein
VTRAARALLAACVVAGAAAAQTGRESLLSARETLVEGERVFRIEAASRPRLLRVFGRREGVPRRDARIELDGAEVGRLSRFEESPSRFSVSLPLRGARGSESRPAVHALRVVVDRGRGGAVVLERVETIDAARVDCLLRDQATKELLKGVFTVTATDGDTPPKTGPIGGSPREGSSWISDDGGGELWVPLGATATFVGRASPFRAAAKFHRRADLAEGALTTFLLPPDVRPPGTTILEPLSPETRLDAARRRKDEALDVAARVGERYRVVDAEEVLDDADGFLRSLEAAPFSPVVATNEGSGRLVPDRVKPLVTARLSDGEIVHSNGPLPLVVDLRRVGVGPNVRGAIELRLPEDATTEAIYVKSGRVEKRLPTSGAGTFAFEIEAAPGAPIVVSVRGPRFTTAPPFERPFAVRVLRAP